MTCTHFEFVVISPCPLALIWVTCMNNYRFCCEVCGVRALFSHMMSHGKVFKVFGTSRHMDRWFVWLLIGSVSFLIRHQTRYSTRSLFVVRCRRQCVVTCSPGGGWSCGAVNGWIYFLSPFVLFTMKRWKDVFLRLINSAICCLSMYFDWQSGTNWLSFQSDEKNC